MEKVTLIEVGPRDGFQNVGEFIPTRVKIGAITRIISAGVDHIQLTSFVNPKAVPQMRDAAEVATYCLQQHPDTHFSALVPNMKGAENARKAGVRCINYVISVSESHNQKNVRRSVAESFSELESIKREFPDLDVTLDIATAWGCPFEGIIGYDRIRPFIDRSLQAGVTSFSVADTIGIATPDRVEEYFTAFRRDFPGHAFGAHIHDTRNMGMVNTLMAVRCGANFVQSSIGGLGGCPFAPGATGNTSSEDIVFMLNGMGYDTGVDFEKLMAAARYVKQHINGNFSGHQVFIDAPDA